MEMSKPLETDAEKSKLYCMSTEDKEVIIF